MPTATNELSPADRRNATVAYLRALLAYFESNMGAEQHNLLLEAATAIKKREQANMFIREVGMNPLSATNHAAALEMLELAWRLEQTEEAHPLFDRFVRLPVYSGFPYEFPSDWDSRILLKTWIQTLKS